jgi:predicted ATPase
MIESLHLRGYRSLRDFRLRLGRVTVVAGENGTGKSNLYRSLALLQRAAEGRLAEAIADEGGMPSLLWAGDRRRDEPHAVTWELSHEIFHYSLQCGLSPADAFSAFRTDPDIKTETLRLGGANGRIVAERKGPMVKVAKAGGKPESLPHPLHGPESFLSEIRDGERHPAVVAAREILSGWRFYHQFRTDPDSPVRRPRIGSWSPVLHHDAGNLAAAWQSIAESGRGESLDEAVEAAFPGCACRAVDDSGAFQMQLLRPGMNRWMTAAELSDGTLRYLALVAALLTPRPPALLVLNEPETSLHPGLITPLADLVAGVPSETQLLVVTHSDRLAEAIEASCGGVVRRLISYVGETRLEGQDGAKRVWIFDDD